MASRSSADVFSSGPSSPALFPNSSVAILERSVSSSMPDRAVIVWFQSSSLLMFWASSTEMPRASKASLPFVAAVDSFVRLPLIASMLVPLCCAMKSHSWKASVEKPIFWDILSMLSPYSAVACAALYRDVAMAPTDATAAVTPAAIAVAPFLILFPKLEENLPPDDLPAFSAAVSVVVVSSLVIVCCAPFSVGIIVTDACATSITFIHLPVLPVSASAFS